MKPQPDSEISKIKIVYLLISLFASVFSLVGCQPGPPDYIYTHPTALDDGLAVGTIEDVGIDTNTLGKAVDRIRDGKYGELHSVLIYKDGMLVFEEYFAGHRYD
ncbi:MAG: hypothetical protein GWN00_15455 [Aliifodinibius sp.]|nr:hypothetical protein [candidate division Zixibacteria bacterium]NIT57567.1 hypothetical protein [Fodinibius sp.]NIR64421.1 hypothetical protein [candidate division Zixibacteria bacterium]NIS46329.1 hypothetical protein [candidate division Zixibacteria bacterium]NIU14420.1 hypothetical protein [candidate division Zixibacteria bacterium]